MNFLKFSYAPYIVFVAFLFLLIVVLQEKRYFKFIQTYWFFKRSLVSHFSSLLFVLGMIGLLVSLMDLRGPEEKIKVDTPTTKTIILIDTSASMLAEDVKPSRLQKAVLIAKHYSRKAAGQQISVIAFAEVIKKIVPFTNDLDLIDSRLDSIKNLRNQYGSSAVSLAIQESVQYFKETGETNTGNILVLTDGEETSEPIDFKVPENIHVALVGVGTQRGGRIPLDDSNGLRFGYKKERGQDITTKLDEKYFRQVVADIPSAKYWLTNTYSLPSEEILDFFTKEKVKGESKQDMIVRPVMMEWIVLPSLMVLTVAFIMKSIRITTLLLLLTLTNSYADDKDDIKLTPEVSKMLNELHQGNLDRLERIKLADELYKAGAKEEGLSLFKENISSNIESEIPPEAYLNYGTALMEKGRVDEGLKIYKSLSDQLEATGQDIKLKDDMDKNILSYFKQKEQKEKKDKEQKENNKENKSQGDKNNSNSGPGNSKDSDNSKSNSDMKKDQNNNQDDQKDSPKDSEEEMSKDSKDEDGTDKEKEKANSAGLPQKNKRKVPAKLKQLMSDDRQLQMKMIENGTKDLNRRKSRKSKDW